MKESVTEIKVVVLLLRVGYVLLLTVAGWQDYKYRRIRVNVFWSFGIAGAILRSMGLALENRHRLFVLQDAGSSTAGGLSEAGARRLLESGVINGGTWYFMGNSGADIAASIAIGLLLLVLSANTREAVGKGDGWFFVVSGIYLGFWRNLALLFGSLFLCLIAGSLFVLINLIKGEEGEPNLKKLSLPFLTFAMPAGLGVLLL